MKRIYPYKTQLRHYRQQRGITIAAVLAIAAVVTILGFTFMGMVRFQVKRTGFEQDTISAAYIAEIGFQQIRAELAAAQGDWTQLTGIVTDCDTTDPFYQRCQRIPNTTSFADFRVVRENPVDPTSPVIGLYEVAVETGEKRSIFGSKTLTGSTLGFVPGSTVSTEQIGYDSYGNQLCDQSTPSTVCPGNYLGVKVKAWLTDSSGNPRPNARPQSVYGVLQLDSRELGDEGPSGYMLESDEDMVIAANTEAHPDTGSIFNTGGFYGPVHTNSRFIFEWESGDASGVQPQNVEIIEKGDSFDPNRFAESVARTFRDESMLFRPFLGVLMAHRNNISASNDDYDDLCTPRLLSPPEIFELGTEFQHWPYFKEVEIKWTGAPQPALGSTYEIEFRRISDNTTRTLTLTRGSIPSDFSTNPFYCDSPHGDYFNCDYVNQPTDASPHPELIPPYEAIEIVAIRQGATTYLPDHLPGGSLKLWFRRLIEWKDGSGTVVSPPTSPNTNEDYCVQYINHSLINIYENMTYSGGSPIYRYWHAHPATENFGSLNQQAHGHNNILGADFAINSVSGDPGYDGSTWRHAHHISNTNEIRNGPIPMASGSPMPNTYLNFESSGYQPANTSLHENPLLQPKGASDINHYNNQLEQLNQYLQLTLGVPLPRKPDGKLDNSVLLNAPFNATSYEQGYILGKFPSSASYSSTVVSKLPSSLQSTEPLVDFRATYFGNDLEYSAGAQAGNPVISSPTSYEDTAWIWVNDNQSDSGFMQVAASRINGNFRRYLYRQIPPSKLLLVRDAVVLMGNFDPTTGSCTSQKGSCLDFHTGFAADPPGRATIVDGQLSILSFTTEPPPLGEVKYYNKGDIVLVGNVLYHNDFYATPSDKTELRQLQTLPESPYSRSNTVNPSITSINDSAVMWVTNTDGTLHRVGGVAVGKLDGLGLFATHDIKFSITGHFNGSPGSPGLPDPALDINPADSQPDRDPVTGLEMGDMFEVHGQLVAGRKVWVHGDDKVTGIPFSGDEYLPDTYYHSFYDSLRIVGTVYSHAQPNFSEYFRVRREYYFDRSLQKNPLIGAPYYPSTPGDYRNQAIFSVFPSLVQGTWVQGVN